MPALLSFVRIGFTRRRKEMRYVSIVTFISVLFLSSATLFQNCMDKYLMQTNIETYGDWILSSVKDYENPNVLFEELNHPYFTAVGICRAGGELLDFNDHFSDTFFGSVNKDFCDIAGLTLYEGRLPEADDEIAMDLSSLSRLGYSYEPGQTIRIAVRRGQAVYSQNFRLTGTIESFADNWKYTSDYRPPNGIVTEEGLSRVCTPLYEAYYYRLGKEYGNLDMEEFTSAFLKPQHIRIYNSYVYDNRVWGSAYLFKAMKQILIFAGALAVGYLMMSYVSQRRKYYYMLRSFGADKTQIKTVILTEAVCGTFPYALCAMLLPCLAGALICFGVSAGFSLPFYFVLRLKDLGGWLFASFGMILFAVLCAWGQLRDKNLTLNRQTITVRQLKRLRKDAKRQKNTGRIFFRRQRLLHPFQRISYILFSCIVCSVLCLCLNQILYATQIYRESTNGLRDFEASSRTDLRKDIYSKDGNSYASSINLAYDMYYGIDSDTVSTLSSLIGIEHIDWQIRDQTHILQWEGKKNTLMEQQKKRLYEMDSHSLNAAIYEEFSFCFFENTAQILKELKKCHSLKGLDEEAFRNGEQIIALLFAYYEISEDGEYFEVRDNTLHPGEQAEIISGEAETYPVKMTGYALPERIPEEYDLPGRIPVTVGAVLNADSAEWENRLPHTPFVILASDKLAERIAQADGQKPITNHMFIDLNKNQSFEATQKRLVTVFKDCYMTYSANYENRQQLLGQFIRQLYVYGIMFCIILFLFLLLQVHFSQMQNRYRRYEYRLLKQLGMDRTFFGRITFTESITQAAWVLCGIPCCYTVLFAVNLMHRTIGREEDGLFWPDSIHFPGILYFAVLLMLFLALITYLSTTKYKKRRLQNENSIAMQ